MTAISALQDGLWLIEHELTLAYTTSLVLKSFGIWQNFINYNWFM